MDDKWDGPPCALRTLTYRKTVRYTWDVRASAAVTLLIDTIDE